jgi:hypothetical protein
VEALDPVQVVFPPRRAVEVVNTVTVVPERMVEPVAEGSETAATDTVTLGVTGKGATVTWTVLVTRESVDSVMVEKYPFEAVVEAVAPFWVVDRVVRDSSVPDSVR